MLALGASKTRAFVLVVRPTAVKERWFGQPTYLVSTHGCHGPRHEPAFVLPQTKPGELAEPRAHLSPRFQWLAKDTGVHHAQLPLEDLGEALTKHGQQCNVTSRKPGQDLPGSNPVVSHFFTLIILYREAQIYSSCFLFSKTNGV